jgi:hypothetical protein
LIPFLALFRRASWLGYILVTIGARRRGPKNAQECASSPKPRRRFKLAGQRDWAGHDGLLLLGDRKVRPSADRLRIARHSGLMFPRTAADDLIELKRQNERFSRDL